MKRFTLITMGLLLWTSNVAFAQFNTVTQNRTLRKTVAKQQTPFSVVPMKDNTKDTIYSGQTETEQTDRLQEIVSPLRRIIVSSPYGLRRDPFTKKKVRHNGLDLKAYYEPAYAMMYGEVTRVGKDKRSGLYVTLRHGNFTVSYCHLSKVTVNKGIYVCPGTVIALTGSSGRSTGPHLHLTVKDTKKGRAIDPSIFLNLIKQTSMGDMFAESIVYLEN